MLKSRRALRMPLDHSANLIPGSRNWQTTVYLITMSTTWMVEYSGLPLKDLVVAHQLLTVLPSLVHPIFLAPAPIRMIQTFNSTTFQPLDRDKRMVLLVMLQRHLHVPKLIKLLLWS
jgi:hypothetical protein